LAADKYTYKREREIKESYKRILYWFISQINGSNTVEVVAH
jgi:hypothetical protein